MHNVAAFQAANGKALVNLRKATQANKVSWTVVAAASEGWAAKVFPELATSEEQVDALWNEIFKTTRIYEETQSLLGISMIKITRKSG